MTGSAQGLEPQRLDGFCAELALEDLAGGRPGERGGLDADVAGPLEAGEVLAEEALQRLDVEPRLGVDGGADLLAQPLVGHGVDGRLVDVRVQRERRLDLAAADVLAAADDEVL